MDLEQRRLDLHEIFVDILGSRKVYFQPPASATMVYPCIVYRRTEAEAKFANNLLYLYKQRYQVTLIMLDPDGVAVPVDPDVDPKPPSAFERILRLPLTAYDRSFAADNLNHDVFNLYF